MLHTYYVDNSFSLSIFALPAQAIVPIETRRTICNLVWSSIWNVVWTSVHNVVLRNIEITIDEST